MKISLLIALVIPVSIHSMAPDNPQDWETIKHRFVSEALKYSNTYDQSILLPIAEEEETLVTSQNLCKANALMLQQCFKATMLQADKMTLQAKCAIRSFYDERSASPKRVILEGIIGYVLRKYALHLADRNHDYLAPHSQ